MSLKKSSYKAEQIDAGNRTFSNPFYTGSPSKEENMVLKANSLIDAINTMEQAKMIMA